MSIYVHAEPITENTIEKTKSSEHLASAIKMLLMLLCSLYIVPPYAFMIPEGSKTSSLCTLLALANQRTNPIPTAGRTEFEAEELIIWRQSFL